MFRFRADPGPDPESAGADPLDGVLRDVDVPVGCLVVARGGGLVIRLQPVLPDYDLTTTPGAANLQRVLQEVERLYVSIDEEMRADGWDGFDRSRVGSAARLRRAPKWTWNLAGHSRPPRSVTLHSVRVATFVYQGMPRDVATTFAALEGWSADE